MDMSVAKPAATLAGVQPADCITVKTSLPTVSLTASTPFKSKLVKSTASCCDSTGVPKAVVGVVAVSRTASLPKPLSSNKTLVPTWVA